MDKQLQQQFDKVSGMCEQMLSKNVEIGLVAANNPKAINDLPPHEYTQQQKLADHLRLPSWEHGMQSKSSPPKKQVGSNPTKKNGGSESKACDFDAYTLKVHQCNQRDNSSEVDAKVALEHHQMKEVLPQPKTASPVNNFDQSDGVLRLKKCQVQLIQKSSESSIKTAANGRGRPLKMHSCADCGKKFFRKCDLIRHSTIHTGEKRFTCGECGRAFGQRATLFKHLLIHTNEKPFMCDVCKRSFRQKGHLSRHMNIHSGEGEKLHKCNVCEKMFRRKSHLITHRRSHVREGY